MKSSVTIEQLTALTSKQLGSLFMLDTEVELRDEIEEALNRSEACYSLCKIKDFQSNGETAFNPFHSGQYCIYLYHLSRILYEREKKVLADKVYYLNKTLNGTDLFYEIDLPEIFGLQHPVGSVIGRGSFSDYFFFFQNCTVGANHKDQPVIGENVMLMAGATVIGNCQIGNNCIISANTYIKDQVIPDNSIVFGTSPDITIKQKESSYFIENSRFFLEE